VASRTQIMHEHDGLGGMMAISSSSLSCFQDIPDVWVAAYNSATDITLGGTNVALDQVAAVCESRGTFHRRLQVTNAYHTPLLACMESEMRSALKTMAYHPTTPTRPLYSTVTGTRVNSVYTLDQIWANMIRPVKFRQALTAIHTEIKGPLLFVECGAHPVLRKYIQAVCDAESLALCARMGREDVLLLETLVHMQRHGLAVDWEPFTGPSDPADRTVHPPTYCYDMTSFPVPQTKDDLEQRLSPPWHPLLHERIVHHEGHVVFKTYVNARTIPFLVGHKVNGVPVVPVAMFIEMAMAASSLSLSLSTPLVGDSVSVSSFEMLRALPLTTDDLICFTDVTVCAITQRASIHIFTSEHNTHCR
jgi:acyl transferase domain-containing protein